MSVNEQAAPAPLSNDEATLHQLGYAQELLSGAGADCSLTDTACSLRQGVGMMPGEDAERAPGRRPVFNGSISDQ